MPWCICNRRHDLSSLPSRDMIWKNEWLIGSNVVVTAVVLLSLPSRGAHMVVIAIARYDMISRCCWATPCTCTRCGCCCHGMTRNVVVAVISATWHERLLPPSRDAICVEMGCSRSFPCRLSLLSSDTIWRTRSLLSTNVVSAANLLSLLLSLQRGMKCCTRCHQATQFDKSSQLSDAIRYSLVATVQLVDCCLLTCVMARRALSLLSISVFNKKWRGASTAAKVEGGAEHFLKLRVQRGDWSSPLKQLKKMTKRQECWGHHDGWICMCHNSWNQFLEAPLKLSMTLRHGRCVQGSQMLTLNQIEWLW